MKIYLIGIGGIGVSALAQYYLANGHKVSGSDLAGSEITSYLKKKGAKIYTGKSLKLHFKIKDLPDLVIYSPAVPGNNPELITAKKFGTRCLSYPEALGELTKEYFTIAVSGTHGKSTTTAMLSLILIKAGLNPNVIIGTKLKEFGNSNFRMGGSPKFGIAKTILHGKKILVIEADEYAASFLNYWPRMIILTNIEADHLDYYKNFKNIKRTFREFVGHLPQNGILILNTKIIDNTFFTIVKKVLWYSLKQREAGKIKKIIKVPGDHNISNALAALTAARALKIPDKISLKVLSEFRGAWRRFEIIRTKPFALVSDYGHNPQKVMAGLKSAREKWPKKKIWCVYQPHQHQRTYYLFNDFVKTFRKAPVDKIIITDIYDVAGREEIKIKKNVNSQKLTKSINKENVIYLPGKKILPHLNKNISKIEVLIIMGAGDIYKLADILAKKSYLFLFLILFGI